MDARTNAHGLDPAMVSLVERLAGGGSVSSASPVQALWSGYGQILRCELDGGDRPSVIVKHVQWPTERDHPRGWSTDRSHERKVESYRVETAWYDRYAAACGPSCRVPTRLHTEHGRDDVVLILEDLDAAGYGGRRDHVDDADLEACLRWLASFHATFLGRTPDGLWPTGTYWHLATRPDELAAMPDGPLRRAAHEIDRRLADVRFRTFVHGDAKLANFCFEESGDGVAAVDFQYVGGGCGMKDLAYFVSSCFGDAECARRAPGVLDRYFTLLADALVGAGAPADPDAVEAEWRPLYPVAWADFTRFLHGWSPGHWKLHGYSARITDEVVATLGRSDPA